MFFDVAGKHANIMSNVVKKYLDFAFKEDDYTFLKSIQKSIGNSYSDVILTTAIKNNKLDMYKSIFDESKISEFELNSLLLVAVGCSNVHFVDYLVSKGITDLDGPLLKATWYLDIDLVVYFVEKGAKNVCEAHYLAEHYYACCKKQAEQRDFVEEWLRDKIGFCVCEYCRNEDLYSYNDIWGSWLCDECDKGKN